MEKFELEGYKFRAKTFGSGNLADLGPVSVGVPRLNSDW